LLQKLSRHDSPGTFGEGADQQELTLGEVNLAVAVASVVTSFVQEQLPDSQCSGCIAGRATVERPQSSCQFVEFKGLDEIIIGACIESDDAVAERVARRDNQYRCRNPCLTKPLKDVNPIERWQIKVQENDVEIGLGRRLKRCYTVSNPLRGVRPAMHRRLETVPQLRIIFDDQDVHRLITRLRGAWKRAERQCPAAETAVHGAVRLPEKDLFARPHMLNASERRQQSQIP
jgi:hypothetical protein